MDQLAPPGPLAGYAGFHTNSPPTAASAFGVYWPTLVPAALVAQTVHLPDGRTQVVRHHENLPLPNLLALNFVIHGLLAPGGSATTRPDAQAKGLGEYLRSRLVPIPADLL